MSMKPPFLLPPSSLTLNNHIGRHQSGNYKAQSVIDVDVQQEEAKSLRDTSEAAVVSAPVCERNLNHIPPFLCHNPFKSKHADIIELIQCDVLLSRIICLQCPLKINIRKSDQESLMFRRGKTKSSPYSNTVAAS